MSNIPTFKYFYILTQSLSLVLGDGIMAKIKYIWLNMDWIGLLLGNWWLPQFFISGCVGISRIFFSILNMDLIYFVIMAEYEP